MFKQVYSGLFIGSTILGVTGLVQCWKTEGITRTLALTVGVAGTSSALVCAGLGMVYDGKHQSQQRELDEKIKDIEQTKKAEINGLELEIRNLKSTISTLETQGTQYVTEIAELKTQLNLKAEQYLKILAEKDLKISKLEGVVSQRDTRVADFLEDSRGYVTNFLNLRYQSLDTLQKTLEKALTNDSVAPFSGDSFEQRIKDIRELKAELSDALREIRELEITDFKIVLDFIFKFDNKFLNVKVRWKDLQAKEVKNENADLRNSLAESMPTTVALERYRKGVDDVDVRLTEKYEALLLNNNSIHAELLDLLEQRNLVINELQQQNEVLQSHLENPFEMYGGSKYAENANKIARYYNDLLKGKKLDCLDWEETELGYKLIFSVRRNPSITLNELKQNESLEQIAYLAQALDGTTPEFTVHSHNATVSLSVQTRRKIQAKPKTIEDVFRENNVIRADNFCSTVAKYHINKSGKPTLRVMSATGGGKGILVKNLVDYYLKNIDGYELWLSDPQDGSDEDYWDCEKAATNPATATKLFNQFAQLLKARDAKVSTYPDTPILGIFDEFDKKHPLDDKKTASEIWTTIRHHAMRLILIGQSGEVGKNKWTWDEMTNCCLLFITDAIGTFLKHADKDLQMNPVKLEKFKVAYDKVKTHIDEVNQDIDTENQYRLAALYCNGQALLLEIPPAHKGLLSDGKSWLATRPFEKVLEREERLSTNTQKIIISNILSEVQNEVLNEGCSLQTLDKVTCPKCSSQKIGSKGDSFHRCLDCGKTWKKK